MDDQWKDQRTEAWRKAWTDLINVCHPDTLNGMYCMLNGGGNLLGAILGGGPYNEDGTVEEGEGDTPTRHLTMAEQAELMTDLAQATEEGMTLARVNEMEAAFNECLSRDEAHDQHFDGDDTANLICRHVIAEFEGGENGDVTHDDAISDFIDPADENQVSELVNDIENRLEAAGMSFDVDSTMVRDSTTIADLCRAISAANQPPD